MTRTLLAALACLLLAACASGESGDTTAAPSDTTTPAPDTTAAAPDTTTADTTTTAPETTAAPQTTEGDSEFAGAITMSNISFSGVTTVQAGDTVELVNNDQVPHTFTAEDESFDVSISGGATATYTFEEPGEYSYFCTIHPSMSGTITVEG